MRLCQGCRLQKYVSDNFHKIKIQKLDVRSSTFPVSTWATNIDGPGIGVGPAVDMAGGGADVDPNDDVDSTDDADDGGAGAEGIRGGTVDPPVVMAATKSYQRKKVEAGWIANCLPSSSTTGTS